MARFFAFLFISVPLAIILIAAASKAVNVPHFSYQLNTWSLIPRDWTPAVAMMIVNLELAVSLAGLLGLLPRAAPLLAAGMLLLFCLAYAVHVWLGVQVRCACFGQLRLLDSMRQNSAWVIGTNLAMIACLLAGACLQRPRAMPDRSSPNLTATHSPGFRAGWSLLEMLVAIAVLSVIIALALPALSRSRDSAQEVASLSNLRQHAAVFHAYAASYDDTYPYFTEPSWCDEWATFGSIRVRTSYFGAASIWNIALADCCYDGVYRSPQFHPPGAIERSNGEYLSVTSEYLYSSTFLADSTFWNYETRTGPGQWRAVRGSEVKHFSKKALFWESWWGELPWQRKSHLFGFVDGSARGVRDRDILPQYQYGTIGPWAEGGCIHTTYGQPGMHSIDGVRGRDER